jgi:plasmid stabilization system protein ParE
VAERYRILWAPTAIHDLDDILVYLATRDGPEAASLVYSKISERIESLVRHPQRCRIAPELREIGVSEYREILVYPYRVFFRVSGHVVGVVGVIDGRRDIEEILIMRMVGD